MALSTALRRPLPLAEGIGIADGPLAPAYSSHGSSAAITLWLRRYAVRPRLRQHEGPQTHKVLGR